MITIEYPIRLYEFHELSDRGKRNAIEEHRSFLLETMEPEDFISGDPEYDTPEELEKMYCLQYDFYLLEDDPVIESIEINEYLFFSTGELANIHYKFNGNDRITYLKAFDDEIIINYEHDYLIPMVS